MLISRRNLLLAMGVQTASFACGGNDESAGKQGEGGGGRGSDNDGGGSDGAAESGLPPEGPITPPVASGPWNPPWNVERLAPEPATPPIVARPTVKGGKLWVGTKELVLFGAHLIESGSAPDPAHAPLTARRLAQLGRNAVRLSPSCSKAWKAGAYNYGCWPIEAIGNITTRGKLLGTANTGAEMTALSADVGDVVWRADTKSLWRLDVAPASSAANWRTRRATVANASGMTSATAMVGDCVFRQDTQSDWYLLALPATDPNHWADATRFDPGWWDRFDRNVKELVDANLWIWLWINDFENWVLAKGFVPGNYKGYGMHWSPTYLQLLKAHLDYVLDHPNPYLGGKSLAELPNLIVIEPSNENGTSDTFTRRTIETKWASSTWSDHLVLNRHGMGTHWLAELNGLYRTYCVAQGWTPPGAPSPSLASFPTREAWIGWPSIEDRKKLIGFLVEREVAYANAMKAYVKGKSPGLLYANGTAGYFCSEANEVSEVISRNNYLNAGIESANALASDYVTPPFILEDTTNYGRNGANWHLYQGTRRPDQLEVTTECGEYGLSARNCHEILESAVHCRQGYNGFFAFCESQTRPQETALGPTGIHILATHPGRKLDAIMAGPILKERLLSEAAVVHVTRYTTADLRAVQAMVKDGALQNGLSYRIGAFHPQGNDGFQRGYWVTKNFQERGSVSNPDHAGIGKITSAQIADGVWMDNQVYLRVDRVRLLSPFLVGVLEQIEDLVLGPLAISGLNGKVRTGTVLLRSDTRTPLFTGRARLGVYRYTNIESLEAYAPGVATPNAGGLTCATDGEHVVGWGTKAGADVMVVTPPPMTITLTTPTRGDLKIQAERADGTLAAVPRTYDPTRGTVRFSTIDSLPLYVIDPV